MIAATWRTIIHRIPGDPFVDFVGKNEGLNIGRAGIAPRARIQGPHGAGTSTVIAGGTRSSGGGMRTDVELATVVSLPKMVADGVDAGKETVATHAHLPLHGAGGAAGERDRARTIVLRAAIRLRVSGRRDVATDVAGGESDCVQSVIHVEPTSMRTPVAAISARAGAHASVTPPH